MDSPREPSACLIAFVSPASSRQVELRMMVIGAARSQMLTSWSSSAGAGKWPLSGTSPAPSRGAAPTRVAPEFRTPSTSRNKYAVLSSLALLPRLFELAAPIGLPTIASDAAAVEAHWLRLSVKLERWRTRRRQRRRRAEDPRLLFFWLPTWSSGQKLFAWPLRLTAALGVSCSESRDHAARLKATGARPRRFSDLAGCDVMFDLTRRSRGWIWGCRRQ